ncbi:hypothetical protein B0H13DRAFT_1870294 [Mycena leptocephala]|nr:hypothetical protein B0H13DRAFT_1870294 [Mycena leptocephala]
MGSAHTLIDAKGQWSGPKQAQSSAVEDIRVFSRADPPESHRVPKPERKKNYSRKPPENKRSPRRWWKYERKSAGNTLWVRSQPRVRKFNSRVSTRPEIIGCSGRAACIGKVVGEDEKRGNWNAVEKNVAHFE